MPKKTLETEAAEMMDMELSTSLQADESAIHTTGNDAPQNALDEPESLVENSTDAAIPDTETANAANLPGDGVENPDLAPSPTTENKEAANLPQAPEDRPENTAAEPVVQETPEPKPKRSRRSVSKPEPESVIQVTPSPQSDEPAADAPVLETSPTRRPRRRAVVSLDGQRSELTPEARRRQDIIDLSESMKSRRVITGTIAGIEHMDESPDLAYAVVYHGAFKVIIPASEMFEFDEDAADNYRGATLSRRLGAEIDYVVKGIETDAGVAAGSRLEAMRQRRREYYLDTDRNGHHQLEAGDIAEARVVSVIRPGAFVELFGIEQFIPLEELSYLRWVDATPHFRVGDRVLVKILELDLSDRNNISLKLSVKQAGEDAFKQAISRFKVGNIYVGNVTMITAVGVFVSFENVSCLCQFPKRKRPAIGSPVTVRILGADLERLRLWGAIVYS